MLDEKPKRRPAAPAPEKPKPRPRSGTVRGAGKIGRSTRAEVEARGDAPECLPKIIAYIRLGMSLRRASEACGVCDETIRLWLNDPTCVVSLAFTQARAEREALWLSQASKDPIAARHREWLLERTNRAEFGQKSAVELSGAVETTPVIVVPLFGPDDPRGESE